MMKSREELIEEFEEWAEKYVKADEHLRSLLPHISDLSRGERLHPLMIADKWSGRHSIQSRSRPHSSLGYKPPAPEAKMVETLTL